MKVIKVHKEFPHRNCPYITMPTERHKTKPGLFQRDTKEVPDEETSVNMLVQGEQACRQH